MNTVQILMCWVLSARVYTCYITGYYFNCKDQGCAVSECPF